MTVKWVLELAKKLFGKRTDRRDIPGVVRRTSPEKFVGKVAGVTVTSSITVASDERTAELNREATRLKESGNWSEAISALEEVQARMRLSGISYPTESWTRLPLFLQQAGRFDDAMSEFNKLLAELEGRMAREGGHHPKRFHLGFAHQPRAVIYDKMRLACKREGRLEDAERYATLSAQSEALGKEFMTKFQAWIDQDIARKRAKLEKKFPSMAKRREARENIDSSNS